jgi:hypothetical protein
MLDNTTAHIAQPAAAPDWHERLSVGDIVSYRFPVADDVGTAQPKARPCLVIDLETLVGTQYAVLAYGTTVTAGPNRGYEVSVRKPHAFLDAGLHKPTKFICARRLLVPLQSNGFVCSAATGDPILGHLVGEERERMNAVRAKLHAERDIAADRREERRERTRRRSRDPRPFVVEHRRPKRPAAATREVRP